MKSNDVIATRHPWSFRSRGNLVKFLKGERNIDQSARGVSTLHRGMLKPLVCHCEWHAPPVYARYTQCTSV